jgi:hypothetical protein
VTVYVEVDSLQAYLDKAGKLGGKTVVPPNDVPGAGTFALFNDLSGNSEFMVSTEPRASETVEIPLDHSHERCFSPPETVGSEHEKYLQNVRRNTQNGSIWTGSSARVIPRRPSHRAG